MSVDSTKLAAVRAQVVFSRMTSAEVCAMLLARGDIASIPGGIPTRLRFDAILAWLEYNQGTPDWNGSAFVPSLLLNGTPIAVKDAIFAQFETGRLTFLTTYGFSAGRIAELIETDAVSVAGAPLDTKIPVWTTPGDTASYSKQNLVPKVVTFWSSTPKRPASVTSIASQLLAQPPGCRVLHVSQITGFINSLGQYAIYDDAVSGVLGAPQLCWFDTLQSDDVSDHMTLEASWQNKTLVEIWELYFAQLRTACNALNVTIDWLMLDLEDTRRSWEFEAADWDAILADPRRASLEAELGFSLGANGAAIMADWAAIPQSHSSKKAWKFDELQVRWRNAHMRQLVEKFTDNFPEANRTEYEYHRKSPSTFATDAVVARGRAPISAGTLIADDDCWSSIYCYGDSISGGRAAYFPRTGVVHPPFVSGNLPWEGFLLDIMFSRHVLASDRGNLLSWVAFQAFTTSGYVGSPLYQEIIYHLRLMGYDLFGWLTTAAAQKPLSDALIESDSFLAHDGWIPDVPDETPTTFFSSTYIASSCDSDGVRKYRVTPKIGSTYSISTAGGGFALTVNGSVVFSIPRVSAVTQVGAGYWVTQTNPVVVELPATVGFLGLLGVLFGATAIALGIKKWPADTIIGAIGVGGTTITPSGPGGTTVRERT